MISCCAALCSAVLWCGVVYRGDIRLHVYKNVRLASNAIYIYNNIGVSFFTLYSSWFVFRFNFFFEFEGEYNVNIYASSNAS